VRIKKPGYEGDKRAGKVTNCVEYKIDVLQLAHASNVSPLIIWGILVGIATTRETTYKILCELNKLAGIAYILDDIQVECIEGWGYR